MWTLNNPEVSFTIDLSSACKRPGKTSKNPIDRFYQVFDKAITGAAAPPFNADPEMQLLLFIPLFGAAELYYRRMIAGVMELCPYARVKASTQQVTIGALQSFGADGVGIAIGEHEGFTSKGQIANRTKSILGVDLGASSTTTQAIKEFESVCHMRHAIVHLNGELLFLNRRELGITKGGKLTLSPEAATLQDVAAKICNAVKAYNTFVCTEVAKRWLDEGHLSGRWSKDRLKFQKFVEFGFSRHDLRIVPDTKGLYQDLMTVHPVARRKKKFVV